jgi:hypothetical protein
VSVFPLSGFPLDTRLRCVGSSSWPGDTTRPREEGGAGATPTSSRGGPQKQLYHLYVSELCMRVSVFNMDGKLLARWGNDGYAEGIASSWPPT